MKRPPGRIIAIAFWLSAAALLILGFEVYLRLSRTRVVHRDTGTFPFAVESDAEAFIEYTPQGRRLIPGSRVLIKNHRISGQDVLMEVNSLGFRDSELPPTKEKDELRVLVLGDSITWADYLPREETYVERTEFYLRKLLPSR
ncbi:MAG: hypothetical protein NTV79_07490 [Candidatus Aureabacteria bacterium]|nr:hypothetical protein [Candidatus Auribacterota bacterium]